MIEQAATRDRQASRSPRSIRRRRAVREVPPARFRSAPCKRATRGSWQPTIPTRGWARRLQPESTPTSTSIGATGLSDFGSRSDQLVRALGWVDRSPGDGNLHLLHHLGRRLPAVGQQHAADRQLGISGRGHQFRRPSIWSPARSTRSAWNTASSVRTGAAKLEWSDPNGLRETVPAGLLTHQNAGPGQLPADGRKRQSGHVRWSSRRTATPSASATWMRNPTVSFR